MNSQILGYFGSRHDRGMRGIVADFHVNDFTKERRETEGERWALSESASRF